MADIQFQCECGGKYRIPSAARGKKVKCASCHKVSVIPLEETNDLHIQESLNPLSTESPKPNFPDLSSFLDENLSPIAATGAVLPHNDILSAAKSQPADPLSQEKLEFEAELAELREQMKEEFMIGHAIMQARGRLNKRIEEAKANAPLQPAPRSGYGLITGIGWAFGGLGGVFLATTLRMIWPSRMVRQSVNIGGDELAGLNAAAIYGKRHAVTAQTRSSALSMITSKEITFLSRMIAKWGATICTVTASSLLLAIALLMNWMQPLMGVVFLVVAIIGWRHLRREFTPLDDAIRDYPRMSVRLGKRSAAASLSPLFGLAYFLAVAASSGWVGWSAYSWGYAMVRQMNGEENASGQLADSSPAPVVPASEPKTVAKTTESDANNAPKENKTTVPAKDASSGTSKTANTPDDQKQPTENTPSQSSLDPSPQPNPVSGANTSGPQANATPFPSSVPPPSPPPSLPDDYGPTSPYWGTLEWHRLAFAQRVVFDLPPGFDFTAPLLAISGNTVGDSRSSALKSPEEAKDRLKTSSLPSVTESKTNRVSFRVTECPFPKLILSRQYEKAAEATVNYWLAMNPGTISTSSNIARTGALEREYHISLQNGNLARVHVVVGGRYCYIVSAVFANETWEPLVNRFFESVKFADFKGKDFK